MSLVVLAKLDAPPLYGGIITAIILGGLAIWAAWKWRKKSPRLAAGALFVGALLVLGSFFPVPDWYFRDEVSGRFGGAVSFGVVGNATVVTSGTASLENGTVTLACEARERCDFVIRHARLAERGNPLVTVDGGPLQLRDTNFACYDPPWTLRILAGTACMVCHADEYVVGEGARGPARLSPAPAPFC